LLQPGDVGGGGLAPGVVVVVLLQPTTNEGTDRDDRQIRLRECLGDELAGESAAAEFGGDLGVVEESFSVVVAVVGVADALSVDVDDELVVVVGDHSDPLFGAGDGGGVLAGADAGVGQLRGGQAAEAVGVTADV